MDRSEIEGYRMVPSLSRVLELKLTVIPGTDHHLITSNRVLKKEHLFSEAGELSKI